MAEEMQLAEQSTRVVSEEKMAAEHARDELIAENHKLCIQLSSEQTQNQNHQDKLSKINLTTEQLRDQNSKLASQLAIEQSHKNVALERVKVSSLALRLCLSDPVCFVLNVCQEPLLFCSTTDSDLSFCVILSLYNSSFCLITVLSASQTFKNHTHVVRRLGWSICSSASLTFTCTCTCYYDEIKVFQDLKIYSHAVSLILSLTFWSNLCHSTAHISKSVRVCEGS